MTKKKIQADLEISLRERVKELNCLYGLFKLIEEHGSSFDKILQGTAELLPPSWQYPEITCARVVFEDKTFTTNNFKESRWKQSAPIKIGDRTVGMVELFYLKKKDTLDEGPFLKEERLLINAVADHIGKTSERIRAEHQLKMERAALENMNIALREVLEKVQDEKKEVGADIQANVDKIIMPFLYALENDSHPDQQGYVNLVKQNLKEIISPFTNRLSKTFMSLTPTEIQICNMIKNGLSTKEISQMRHISPPTVSRHREHIRNKLGVTNKDVNLTTYLHTFMAEGIH